MIRHYFLAAAGAIAALPVGMRQASEMALLVAAVGLPPLLQSNRCPALRAAIALAVVATAAEVEKRAATLIRAKTLMEDDLFGCLHAPMGRQSSGQPGRIVAG
jgi:hypothetical protein